MVSWEEVLKRLLRRGKVSQAAILDPEGRPLASLPDLNIATGEGEGLVKAATCSNYSSSFKLPFAGTRFTCFYKEQGVLVGTAGEAGLVLVGKKTRGGLFVVGLASSELPGSCLYEVTEFAKTLPRGKNGKKSGNENRNDGGMGVDENGNDGNGNHGEHRMKDNGHDENANVAGWGNVIEDPRMNGSARS